MTNVFNRICWLFTIVICVCISAFGQSSGNSAPSKILAGLVDPSMLSPNFVAFGAGNQPGSGGKINGNTVICHAVTSVNFMCANGAFGGSTTATTAQLQQVLLARGGFVAAIDAGAGIATGANNGAGLAVRTSGTAMYNASRLKLLARYPGMWLGFNGSWDKRDVEELVRTRTFASLRPFASKGSYTAFVGYSWK